MKRSTKTHLLALPHLALLLAAVAGLSGCSSMGGLFASPDAVSRQNIDHLRQTHLAFIDEFTEGGDETWNDQRLATRTAAVEKEFAKAEQYENSKNKDAARERALTNLHNQFKSHAGFLERRKKFYRAGFARELKAQLASNYAQALRGEDVRQKPQ